MNGQIIPHLISYYVLVTGLLCLGLVAALLVPIPKSIVGKDRGYIFLLPCMESIGFLGPGCSRIWHGLF